MFSSRLDSHLDIDNGEGKPYCSASASHSKDSTSSPDLSLLTVRCTIISRVYAYLSIASPQYMYILLQIDSHTCGHPAASFQTAPVMLKQPTSCQTQQSSSPSPCPGPSSPGGSCSLCGERILACTLPKHRKDCPAMPVVCRYCGARLRDISLDPDPEEYTIIRNKYRCGYC